VNPNRSAEIEIKQGTNISSLVHRASSKDSYKGHRVSLETLSCDCNNHIKEISLDVKLILQRAPVSGVCTLPVARLLLADDRRPPEAIPCHPDWPG